MDRHRSLRYRRSAGAHKGYRHFGKPLVFRIRAGVIYSHNPTDNCIVLKNEGQTRDYFRPFS